MKQKAYYDLIDNMRYYRNKNRISQEQLAELADLSASYIKQIESGRIFKNVSFMTLIKIANALDIELCTLLCERVR